jgi:drug/metabolite transporter (DMT)-like permease
VTANAMFLLAARSGLLSLAAVVSSLYPAGTVVLARVVLHERITTRQQAGLALALTGVVLIAL